MKLTTSSIVFALVASTLVSSLGEPHLITTVAAASSVPSRPIRWLAAGDSYSSGEGLPDVSEPTCQRADQRAGHTSEAWAKVAQGKLPPNFRIAPGEGATGGFDFVACTGAVTDDLFNNNNNKLEWTFGDNSKFDLVTFSFGGNDVGFDQILKACLGVTDAELAAYLQSAVVGGVTGGFWGAITPVILSWLNRVGCPPDADIRAAIDKLVTGGNLYNGKALRSLSDFYSDVANRIVTPGGNVVVVGYPEIIEDPKFWPAFNQLFGVCQGIRISDALMLRGIAGYLNQTIGQAVAAANSKNTNGVHFTFVDVNTGDPSKQIEYSDARLFEPNTGSRHNLCSAQPWLNGITTGLLTTGLLNTRKERSFHPTQDGHNNEGNLIASVIEQLNWNTLDPLTTPTTTTTATTTATTTPATLAPNNGTGIATGTWSGAWGTLVFSSPGIGILTNSYQCTASVTQTSFDGTTTTLRYVLTSDPYHSNCTRGGIITSTGTGPTTSFWKFVGDDGSTTSGTATLTPPTTSPSTPGSPGFQTSTWRGPGFTFTLGPDGNGIVTLDGYDCTASVTQISFDGTTTRSRYVLTSDPYHSNCTRGGVITSTSTGPTTSSWRFVGDDGSTLSGTLTLTSTP